jgi:hypothetical protein
MFPTINQISQTRTKIKINILTMVLKEDRDFKIMEVDLMWTLLSKLCITLAGTRIPLKSRRQDDY